MESAPNHPPRAPLLRAEQPKPSGSVLAGSSVFSVAWFHRLTIEQRVLAGFSLVFVGILIVSAISYRNTSILLTNSELDVAAMILFNS